MAGLDTHGPTIVGVTWSLFVLCSGFLAIRLYAKFSRGQGMWWDDWVLVFSWVMLLIESILTQYGYQLGYGRHYYDIPPENLSTIAIGTAITATISCFASTGSKISFGVTLLRLTFGWWRRFVWFAIISLFVVMLPSALLTWVRCKSIEAALSFTTNGNCWDESIIIKYGYFNAAICALLDFALALIPIKLISGLQMKTKEKIGVSIAMSMGLLAGLCAIIKGFYLGQVNTGDFYYNGIDVTIWTVTETVTAIIGASIPVLRVLFKEKMSSRGYHISDRDRDMPLSTIGGTKRTRTFRDDDVEPAFPNALSTGWSTTVTAKEDNESDRSILRNDKDPASAGIMHTSEYVIDFHQADNTGRA